MRALRFGIAGVAALVEASIAVALVFTSTHDDRPWLVAGFAVTAGLSFVLAGLVALWRRPDNNTGFLLAATGYLWFVSALNEGNDPWVWTIGYVLGNLALVCFAALILAYPDGTLDRRDRWLIGVGGGAVILSNATAALVAERPVPACDSCPASAVAIAESPSIRDAVILVGSVIVGIVLLWIAAILVRRWRTASPPERRTLRPVYAACGVALGLMLAAVVVDQLGSRSYTVVWVLFLIAFAAVPLTFLAGVLRSRFDRSAAARLLVSLDAGIPLRDVLADALHDPSLKILYWVESLGRWVDELGHEAPPPTASPTRSVTRVERGGQLIAALVHDPALDADPELVELIAAGASLPLENVRLQADLRSQFLFLETVANTAPSLLVVLGTDGRILNRNQATLAASGLPEDRDVRGRFFWDVFIEESEREAMQARFHEAAPGFPPSHYENEFTDAAGERRVIEWGSAPVVDPAGRVTSIVVGGIDVTERKQRELQLQRERDITATLMQAIPSLVVVVDNDGAIVDAGYDESTAGVNNAFRNALGWADAQLVRRNMLDFIDPVDWYVASMMIAGAASGVVMPEHESRWLCHDGGRIDVAWTATPIDDVTGRAASLVLLSGVDVTERKRQEAEIHASRARIIEAAGEARRKLERNLHDGAQQRLVSLSVSLRLAESLLDSDPEAARKVIMGSREELAAALAELRELARGIHPAVLTDQGLAAALDALAIRTPLPIEIAVPPDRLPAPVEAAVYYVVSEAVTNVVKHARATSVVVTVIADEYVVTATIADDGVGGANVDEGTGLRGLVDRVAALDGSLRIESDGGTRVVAEIPLEAPATASGRLGPVNSSDASVTFLLCDIEGSTRLVHETGNSYATILTDVRRILRCAVSDNAGSVIDAHGDEMFAAFTTLDAAVGAAVEAQRGLIDHGWPGDSDVRVRMGIHVGTPIVTDEGYTGIDVHRAARIGSAGHGGQILLSSTASSPSSFAVRALGTHRLAGLPEPEHIHQLLADGLPRDFPPLRNTIAMLGDAMKVVIAEDSVLLREGVARLLGEAGFEVAAQSGTADDLLRHVALHRPAVAIVDIRMPPTHSDEGLVAARKIRETYPETGVLVLSQYVEPAYAIGLLEDGAEGVGYLLKDRISDLEEFASAVRRVGDGGSALDPEVVSQLLGRRRVDDPLDALTPREREVMELIAEGRSNQAIADRMFVTLRAVEKHVTSIFTKLDLPATTDDHRRVLAVLAFLRD